MYGLALYTPPRPSVSTNTSLPLCFNTVPIYTGEYLVMQITLYTTAKSTCLNSSLGIIRPAWKSQGWT